MQSFLTGCVLPPAAMPAGVDAGLRPNGAAADRLNHKEARAGPKADPQPAQYQPRSPLSVSAPGGVPYCTTSTAS